MATAANIQHVLALNCGSATIKYKLYAVSGDLGEPVQQAVVTVERDYRAVLRSALEGLRHRPQLVGHRIVHGGGQLVASAAVTPRVRQIISQVSELAPLHNAPGLLGIDVAAELGVPMVVVLDTAFHHTLPEHAYRYALPSDMGHHVRRYGFHGISHQYVTQRWGALHGVREPTLITLHLGGGCSATAVRAGRSVDTSMGYGPLEGLVMGTRCGDLDPTILLELGRKGRTLHELDELLNRRSGLLGMAGTRNVAELVTRDDEAARLALNVFCYRVRKYVGAYLSVLEGETQAVVFTGGIGENAAQVRARCLDGLAWAGMEIDPRRNEGAQGEACISKDGTRVPVWVIPTDEERVIAREALDAWRS